MKRRFWSVCLALALCWTLLPAPALAAGEATVYVGGKALTSTNDTTVYATTDEDGNVITDSADADDYNIKWDGTTLTLKDATITEGAHQNAAICREGGLEIELIGENTVTGPDNSSEDSTGIYIYQGDLTIDAEDDSATLAVSGGPVTSQSRISSGIRTDNGDITISGGHGQSRRRHRPFLQRRPQCHRHHHQRGHRHGHRRVWLLELRHPRQRKRQHQRGHRHGHRRV